MEAYEQDVDILELLAKAHLQSDDPFTATIILLNAHEWAQKCFYLKFIL